MQPSIRTAQAPRGLIATAATLALLLAGCASIFGIEEGKPMPVATGGNASGGGGQGGQGGQGGLEPFGGHGGSGGEGGVVCVLGDIEEPVVVAELNSAWDDAGPSVSPDGLTVYFTSNRRAAATRPRDLWVATRPDLDTPFDTPVRVGGFADDEDDNDPDISANGLVLYFGSYRDAQLPVFKGDIWTAERSNQDAAFGLLNNLGTTVNSSAHESDPSLSANEQELFFVSWRPDELDPDLWVTTRITPGGAWPPPQPVAGVNTSDAEHDPHIADDGLTLYFSSDRDGGDTDIWRTTRSSPTAGFTGAARVEELRSTARDEDLTLSADGTVIFFASDRPGGAGRMDIWTARRPCQ